MSHLHLQLPVAAPRISAAYTGLRIDGILRRHRQILLEILLLIAAFLFNQGTPAAERQTFRFADINEKALELWEGAQPVLVYNYGVITNSTLTDAAPHSCYVHPLYGLDGEVLTGDFPNDHPYHRGLYWAWPHIKIDGKEYDLWSLRGIEQKFQRWLAREARTNAATLGVENAWFIGHKKVMREEVWLRIQPATTESRSIDLELTWTPLEEPITLWGAPEKSYGGLTLRFGDRSKTVITVPSGRTTEDLVVTKLPWADFGGDFGAPNILSGAAIFVHPTHPAYPPEWIIRHYGLLAVGYPGVTPKAFPRNQSFTCRYRIWVHRGNPHVLTLTRAFDAFQSETKTAIRKNGQ